MRCFLCNEKIPDSSTLELEEMGYSFKFENIKEGFVRINFCPKCRPNKNEKQIKMKKTIKMA